jgi:3-oxoacyl-[acyl-carrier-protein] synthase II
MNHTDPEREIVVSGIGVVCAIGNDVPAFEAGLRSGRCGIDEIRAFDPSGFRSRFAGEVRDLVDGEGLPPVDRRLRYHDRASQLMRRAANEALRQSNRSDAPVPTTDCGIVLGSCGGGYLGGMNYLRRKLAGRRQRLSALLDLPLHAAASHLAADFGCLGPISIISNACASSAIAIADACDRLRAGECSAMLTGGFDALTPMSCAGFGALRNSSPSNRLRPFDAERDGMLLGEGAAALVLETRAACRRRGAAPIATVLACSITSDTYHMTAPDPTGRGAATAMSLALRRAGLDPADIDYVNAHGTGTVHNDAMEAQAIRRVFGERTPPTSSTKSMIGHTLGAAGAIELVACILALRSGFLPPTIGFATADADCGLDVIPNQARTATPRHIVSNSFGFGGSNCSIVVGHPER